MACGRRNESVRPNVGVSKSQAFYLRYVDPLALNMLAQRLHAAAHRAHARGRRSGFRLPPVRHHRPPEQRRGAHRPGMRPVGRPHGRSHATPRTATASPVRKRWRASVSGFPQATRCAARRPPADGAGGRARRRRPDVRACRVPSARRGYASCGRSSIIPEIDVRVDLHDRAVAELRRVLEEFKRYRDSLQKRAAAHPGECDSRGGVAAESRRQARRDRGAIWQWHSRSRRSLVSSPRRRSSRCRWRCSGYAKLVVLDTIRRHSRAGAERARGARTARTLRRDRRNGRRRYSRRAGPRTTREPPPC